MAHKSYTVAIWDTDPKKSSPAEERRFGTFEEAHELYSNPPECCAYVQLVRTSRRADASKPGYLCRVVKPELMVKDPEPKSGPSSSDEGWRQERAMEAGMLHGLHAYNEVMGLDLES